MNIKTERIIDPMVLESGERLVKKAIEKLSQFGNKIAEKVQKDYVPMFDDLVRTLTGAGNGLAFGKEVEQLDMATLIEFAKSNIVTNSNEIVAMKTKDGDDYYIYLTYSKDRELLPVSNNKYLIIKSKSLSEEVENLFAKSELVILK